MKKIKLLLSLCLLMAATFSVAQSVPQAINFQAIARDAGGEPMANTAIMIQLTILDGSADGPQAYREIRSLQTNAYGSFSFQIGRDPYMASGSFADIDWAGSPKFLRIDYDPTATLSFNLSLGTIEFVTVPYAFTAGSVAYIDAEGASDGDVLTYNAATGRFEPQPAGAASFTETDPTVPAWAKESVKPTYYYDEILGTPEIPDFPEIPTNVSAFNNDMGYLTGYTETDPSVPAWAKAANKPVYSYSEIEGVPEVPEVPANVSAFENDANYLTEEADPTIHDWAKAENKPVYSYSEIEGVPEIPEIPAKVSAFENDANYLTSYTETQTLADVAAKGNAVNAQIKNVTNPTDAQDAVTKSYMDAKIATLNSKIAQIEDILEILENIQFGGHEYVDLGLPSGTLWATCNVGANAPEEYGDYFAWGETEPQADNAYNWSSYKYANGANNKLTKYCYKASYGDNGFTDNLTRLLSEDDAATANWGGNWRMPTEEEWQELYNNTTSTWTTQNGVKGRLFTASNGNSVFLPAAGYRWDGSLYYVGSGGDYWSSSLNTDNNPSYAWYLCFGSGGYDMYYDVSRYHGFTVRPVCCVSQK